MLEIVHFRPVRLHGLAPIADSRFETWLQLPACRITFGRVGPHTDGPHVQLGDGTVSKRQAALMPFRQGWGLVDLVSNSGTWVGNQRITARAVPYELRDGDVIRFGDATCRFHPTDAELTSDPTEQGLLDAIRDRVAGGEDVYLDWLEQNGHDDRVAWLRLVRVIEPEGSVSHEHADAYRFLTQKIDRSWRVRFIAARGRAS